MNGTLDLLVETEEGLWILDHKSDATPATPHARDTTPDLTPRATTYLPQLHAYATALRAAAPDRSIAGVGLHWIAAGAVSLVPLGEEDA